MKTKNQIPPYKPLYTTINTSDLKLDPDTPPYQKPEDELKEAQDKKSQIAILKALARFLPSDAKSDEVKLRPALINASNGFRTSKYELGKVLNKYRELYQKIKRRKGKPYRFDQVLEAIGCERSSAYRYIAGYMQANGVREDVRELANERGMDLAETKHSKLVTQIKIATSKGELSPAEVLDKASTEVERLSKVSAPTIPKEPGPMPVQVARNKSFDYAKRKLELIAEYRKRLPSPEEADKVIDALIVAALEAQLDKLPAIKEAA